MHGPLLLLADVSVGIYFIEDLATGTVRAWRPEVFVQEVIQWEGDGCTLLVRLDDSMAEIYLDGRVKETIFGFDQIPPSGGANSIPTLSPDKTWVSYLVGTGDYEILPDLDLSHYEMEELQTMPVDGQSGPYRISENGGARRSAWSPDSEKIALSDYDNQGRLQLFLAKRDGSERTQLTHFESSVDMMEISWSSDGQRIAAAYDSDGDDFQDAILTANTQGDLNPAIFENKVLWWWRDTDSVFAGEPGDGLVLLDIHTGKVLDRWSTFGHLSHLIAPYQSDSDIGYFSSEGTFAVLDTVDNQITGFSSSSQPLADLAYWFESPATFLGEDECRSQ